MKKTRKIVSILLAMVMLLAMSVTAFAAENTGSITISNATKGENYNAYRIFDATYANGAIAYFATKAQKDFYTTQAGNPFTFEDTQVDGKYNVTTTAGDSEVIAFLQKFVTKTGDGPVTVADGFKNVTTALTPVTGQENGTAIFEHVPYGYYLITSSLGAAVTVNSNNPDVTVIDKNQGGPSWDNDGKGKTIENGTINGDKEQTTVNFGDIVDFKIGVDTTNYNGDKKITEYYIFDQMAAGMEYLQNDQAHPFTVKVGNQTLQKGTDYTYAVDGTNGFKLTIPWVDSDGSFKYASPSNITVTYSAKVLDTAEIAGSGNKNTAKFDFSQEGDPEPNPGYHTSTEEKTTTYTFALAVIKTDKNGAPLAGAKFTVKGADNNPVKVSAINGKTGYYKYDPNGSAEVESPASGVIVIEGVKAGTYTFAETQAPAGYNLLKDKFTVEAQVASSTNYTTSTTIYYDGNGNIVDSKVSEQTIEKTFITDVRVAAKGVINKAGTELPSTGGMGTTIFYVVGSVLLIGAAVALITKRRMNVNKSK